VSGDLDLRKDVPVRTGCVVAFVLISGQPSRSIMQLGDFSAHVVVDGKELEEYDVVIDSPTKATCYVASEEGKVRL
jgi:hypothetical protein